MAGPALQLLHIILVETNRLIVLAGMGDSFVKNVLAIEGAAVRIDATRAPLFPNSKPREAPRDFR